MEEIFFKGQKWVPEEFLVETNNASASTTVDGPTVPKNEFWKILSIHGTKSGAAAAVKFRKQGLGVVAATGIHGDSSVTECSFSGEVWLEEGQFIKMVTSSANLIINITGIKYRPKQWRPWF